MPSVYIRSKHESLSTLHGAMCVNFLNRFPNALLEDFEKVYIFTRFPNAHIEVRCIKVGN